MAQVYPDCFDRIFVQQLARHPRILVIRHPFKHLFQVYEVPRGSSAWSAERLHSAIVTERENIESEGAPKHFWWNWPGAPYLLDEVSARPGSWLLAYLDDRERRKQSVPIKEWETQMDAAAEAREAARKKVVHDAHVAMGREEFHRLRDISRGDEPRKRSIFTKEA